MRKLSIKYENLLKLLIKFQKELLKSNIINSHLALCEIFVFLCDEKKYLDMKIYDNISDFKTKFQNSYNTYSFLGFKGANVKNKEELLSDILDIIKVVSDKI